MALIFAIIATVCQAFVAIALVTIGIQNYRYDRKFDLSRLSKKIVGDLTKNKIKTMKKVTIKQRINRILCPNVYNLLLNELDYCREFGELTVSEIFNNPLYKAVAISILEGERKYGLKLI